MPATAAMMPSPTPTPASDQLTLDDVVRDTHMQSVFLQYLSSHDKKGFARLLFLVSVDEFKKLLGSSTDSDRRHDSPHHDRRPSVSTTLSNNRSSSSFRDASSSMIYDSSSNSSMDDDDDDVVTRDATQQRRRHSRQLYASKIIAKFMSKGAFLDIASENLEILNKSVWSFGNFLKHDLVTCAGLSSKVDLFYDAELAVKTALQPSFDRFVATDECLELVQNARLTLALVAGDTNAATLALAVDDMTIDDADTDVHTPVPTPTKASTYLTVERVLSNRRLCSVFWVYLFKERTHEQLSLWMDARDHLLPLLRAFVDAATLDTVAIDPQQQQQQQQQRTDALSDDEQHASALIEQLLAVGSRIASKYVAVDASTSVTFVGDDERLLLIDYADRIAHCVDSGSFALSDAVVLLRTVERIAAAIEDNLRVNHFVRFMGSESFKSLVACYQSRLLSPSGVAMSPNASPEAVDTAPTALTESSASDSSVTTLQELFQCMNVPSHQPQRLRSKTFTLRDLLQSQIRGDAAANRALVSSVISFRLDVSDKNHPVIEKNVLYTLATTHDADLQHHHAIPDHVEAFFCPAGAEVVRATTCPAPTLFHMTIGNAEKAFYGAILTRYVAQSDESQLGPLELVLRETDGLEVYVPVGLCVISRYPILDTLKKRLNDLHVGMRRDALYFTDATWTPSVAEMSDLLAPFDFTTLAAPSRSPSPVRRSDDDARRRSTSSHHAVVLPSLTTYVDFSMEELFNCLSVENVVALVTCMLLERQIVLVSAHYSVLTCVGETLKRLVAPLVWSHVFAPILPKSMLECLQCPTPYLFGVHASYKHELLEMLAREGSCDSIVMVDLDANTLSARVEPLLPEALRAPLVVSLEQLLKPRVYFSDFVPMCGVPAALATSPPATSSSSSHGRRGFPERRVRLCFEHTIAQLLDRLEEYRFVLSDDFDYVVVFDRVAFKQRLPPAEQAFYRAFLETQVFSHAIATVA